MSDLSLSLSQPTSLMLYFFLPCPAQEVSDKAALVGTWFPAKVNPPRSQTLIFKYSHTLKFLTIDIWITALTVIAQQWHDSSSVAKHLNITTFVGQSYIIFKYMTIGLSRKNNHHYYCLFWEKIWFYLYCTPFFSALHFVPFVSKHLSKGGYLLKASISGYLQI